MGHTCLSLRQQWQHPLGAQPSAEPHACPTAAMLALVTATLRVMQPLPRVFRLGSVGRCQLDCHTFRLSPVTLYVAIMCHTRAFITGSLLDEFQPQGPGSSVLWTGAYG